MVADKDKMRAFVGKMLDDLGAASVAPLVLLGDRLGLYRALAGGSFSSAALAEKTGLEERYVREWLAAQATSGYVTYDAEAETFRLSPEQSAVFADPDSPVFMAGAFYSLAALWIDEPKVEKAFRTGQGIGWGEYHPCLFCGTEKFFRPAYRNHLIEDWIPALDGMEQKLKAGARVADVGCGHGVSTILLGKSFPESKFYGFDLHGPSIEHAREMAQEAGVGNVTFELGKAKSFPGEDYDLVAFFDCLHDMGDPVGASAYVRSRLTGDGRMMVVEPCAGDRLADNFTPVGRLCYAFSTLACTPVSKSQEVGLALGAQAGKKRLSEVIREGGFSSVRCVAETAFNIVLEA
ncbi:MAG: class I SAM-dependent methyltransferase, partial [Phycisphaerae bacterium]